MLMGYTGVGQLAANHSIKEETETTATPTGDMLQAVKRRISH